MPTTAPEKLTPKGRAIRERIVAAAAELMSQRGVARTTVEDIQEAAAVSISQMYHYFAWQRGSAIVTRRRETAEGPLQGFVDQLSRRRGLLRVPGTTVFLSRGNTTAPLALRANVTHNHVLHDHVVIVTIDTLAIPRVADSERIEIDPLGDTHDGIIHVNARFGYMETPDVPRMVRLLDPAKAEELIAIDDVSYFLSTIELTKGAELTMSAWRRNLFIATSRLSSDGAEFFGLPQDRTLIEGSRIEVGLASMYRNSPRPSASHVHTLCRWLRANHCNADNIWAIRTAHHSP
jgi:K+ transporter